MNQLEHLRAMFPGDAISAIAEDLVSSGSTYSSVGAGELIKACGLKVEEGSLSIVWVDMPLSEAEDLANFVYELEDKVPADLPRGQAVTTER